MKTPVGILLLVMFSLALPAAGSEQMLLAAAGQGQVEQVKSLLAQGVDANARNGAGRPALVLAAFNGNERTVRALLAAGADVNGADNAGNTALMEAADRVDSTTGQQMAYLKQWPPRAARPLRLRVPELLPGTGRAILGDARDVVRAVEPVDLAYLDPPYNQHRYFTNYHVWETLIRWDAPATYGVARKRVDARDPATRNDFNRRREMPVALDRVIRDVRAQVVLVSSNDESWVDVATVCASLRGAGHRAVQVVGFDSRRYVGAQIGIYSPAGRPVGTVGRLRNTEYVFVAGPPDQVEAAVAAGLAAGGQPVSTQTSG